MPKYVFVTGGVTSSLGKGITAASIGRILKARGIPVSILDPFQRITVNESEYNPEMLAELGPSMAIAVGVAIRKLGDA